MLKEAPTYSRIEKSGQLPLADLRPFQIESRPIDIFIARRPNSDPKKDLLQADTPQGRIIGEIIQRIQAENQRSGIRRNGNMEEKHAQMAIIVGDGTNQSESLRTHVSVLSQTAGENGKKSIPLFLFVDSVPDLKVFGDIDSKNGTRKIIAGKKSHNGFVFEHDEKTGKVKRVLCISMQGNHIILEGDEGSLLNEVVYRVQNHYGARFITNRRERPYPKVTFDQWAESAIHKAYYADAHAIGAAGIKENHVDLEALGMSSTDIKDVLDILKRNRFGESTTGTYVPELGILAQAKSGGDKIFVSADPLKGDLIPVIAITPDGYEAGRLLYTPDELQYDPSSVETREVGSALIIKAAIQEGKPIHNYAEFVEYRNDLFRRFGSIEISSKYLKTDITAEHIHWQPVPGTLDPDFFEIVEPDIRYARHADNACGTDFSEAAFISALFKSKAFSKRSPDDQDPFNGKMIVVKLDGHGMWLIGRSRKEVTKALLEMQLQPPLAA